MPEAPGSDELAINELHTSTPAPAKEENVLKGETFDVDCVCILQRFVKLLRVDNDIRELFAFLEAQIAACITGLLEIEDPDRKKVVR